MKCSCCSAIDDIQMHHLYPKSQGCPDDLMIPLCYKCHRKAHGLNTSLNHSELIKKGIRKARERGVPYRGRKPSYTRDQLDVIVTALGNGVTVSGVARDNGVTRQTVLRIRDDQAAAEAALERWGM